VVSEESQKPGGGGIDYASLVPDPDGCEQPVSDGTDVTPLTLKAPERVDFGIDAFGQWCIEVRAKDGTLLETAEYHRSRHGLDLAEFPADSPAGAVALQEALKQRYQFAEIVWRPGVMNSVDEKRSLAQRALAAAAADRQAAIEAAETAETSLRQALEKARAAGIGSGEMGTPAALSPRPCAVCLRCKPPMAPGRAAPNRLRAPPSEWVSCMEFQTIERTSGAVQQSARSNATGHLPQRPGSAAPSHGAGPGPVAQRSKRRRLHSARHHVGPVRVRWSARDLAAEGDNSERT
jgi:hypothetical protein